MPLPLYTKTDTRIKKIIGVAAGKGGVGKSFVAANLARALKARGYQVGLLDGDLYGPSLKKMLPVQIPPKKEQERWLPGVAEGIRLLSLAHFCPDGDSFAVRAPIATRLIQEFLTQTDWGPLDALIIDFPPGTGDIQLTIAQKVSLEAVFLVTTPQSIATNDVRRAWHAFDKMGVPLAGLIENMSYFIDPHGQKHFPFGQGGGALLSKELKAPLLASLPLSEELSRFSDKGSSLFAESGLKEVQNIFFKLAEIAIAFESPKGISHIAPLGPFAFGIEWSDGLKQRFELAELQAHCPCASCQGAGKTLGPVRAKGILEAGRYAIKIDFETGCKNGIFTHDFLRGL